MNQMVPVWCHKYKPDKNIFFVLPFADRKIRSNEVGL